LLLCSLFVMTFGVALCVRSNLGSSVISSVPLAMTHAGEAGKAPGWTIGDYTNVMNIVLVFGQMLILRSRFEKMQLFQLIIGFLFCFLLDVNMRITASVVCDSLLFKAVAQTAGCLVLGIGIAFEVRCGSVTMPGEGFPAAISRACGAKFAKAKICVDVSQRIAGGSGSCAGVCVFRGMAMGCRRPGHAFCHVFRGDDCAFSRWPHGVV